MRSLEQGLVLCPACSAAVRSDRLNRHVTRVHAGAVTPIALQRTPEIDHRLAIALKLSTGEATAVYQGLRKTLGPRRISDAQLLTLAHRAMLLSPDLREVEAWVDQLHQLSLDLEQRKMRSEMQLRRAANDRKVRKNLAQAREKIRRTKRPRRRRSAIIIFTPLGGQPKK